MQYNFQSIDCDTALDAVRIRIFFFTMMMESWNDFHGGHDERFRDETSYLMRNLHLGHSNGQVGSGHPSRRERQ